MFGFDDKMSYLKQATYILFLVLGPTCISTRHGKPMSMISWRLWALMPRSIMSTINGIHDKYLWWRSRTIMLRSTTFAIYVIHDKYMWWTMMWCPPPNTHTLTRNRFHSLQRTTILYHHINPMLLMYVND